MVWYWTEERHLALSFAVQSYGGEVLTKSWC